MPYKDPERHRQYLRGWYKSHVDMFKKRDDKRTKEDRRRVHVKWFSGLDWKTYQSMVVLQGNRCAICGDEMQEVHVDHDHRCCPGKKACGKCVRGLLCTRCNSGLGLFRDNIENLLSAVRYLCKGRELLAAA